MSERITRRAFHTTVAGGLVVSSIALNAQAPAAPAAQAVPQVQTPPFERDYPAPKFKPQFKKPQISSTLVQDFVIYAHGELDMVKLLLEKYPAVLNATMDWGGGDWESGLGGASHMGRRDIALFLLEKGARIDIFAAAALGYLDVVKATLMANPGLIDAKGPHGIPLMVHAKQGGKEAEAVMAYLQAFKKP